MINTQEPMNDESKLSTVYDSGVLPNEKFCPLTRCVCMGRNCVATKAHTLSMSGGVKRVEWSCIAFNFPDNSSGTVDAEESEYREPNDGIRRPEAPSNRYFSGVPES